MEIPNDYNIEDIIYLKHDIEQLPRMVTAIIWDGHKVMYEVICAESVSQHYQYEISNIKTIY